MGFFRKLFHKEEDLDAELGLDKSPLDHPDQTFSDNLEHALPQDNLGLEEKPVLPEMHQEQPSPFEQPRTPTTSPATPQRDLELISSKLDTLKAILNSMDQRIAQLEKAAGVEQKKMPW